MSKSEQQKSVKTPVLSLTVCGREKDLQLISTAEYDLKKVLNIVAEKIDYDVVDEDIFIKTLELELG